MTFALKENEIQSARLIFRRSQERRRSPANLPELGVAEFEVVFHRDQFTYYRKQDYFPDVVWNSDSNRAQETHQLFQHGVFTEALGPLEPNSNRYTVYLDDNPTTNSGERYCFGRIPTSLVRESLPRVEADGDFVRLMFEHDSRYLVATLDPSFGFSVIQFQLTAEQEDGCTENSIDFRDYRQFGEVWFPCHIIDETVVRKGEEIEEESRLEFVLLEASFGGVYEEHVFDFQVSAGSEISDRRSLFGGAPELRTYEKTGARGVSLTESAVDVLASSSPTPPPEDLGLLRRFPSLPWLALASIFIVAATLTRGTRPQRLAKSTLRGPQ